MHMICDNELSTVKQHSRCPKEKYAWCKDDINNNSSIYCKTKNRLPAVFKEELKPLFTRLTYDELLNRCLMGLAQNQNESINNILWSICPKKTNFVVLRKFYWQLRKPYADSTVVLPVEL